MDADVGTHSSPEARVRIDVRLTAETARRALLDEARRGLTAHPPELSPKWLYDARGSALFEEITQLPEYYPTRREREILTARAEEIAVRSAADTLVELGSGSAAKTRLLLGALASAGRLARYVPFDVSESMLREASLTVAAEFPGLEVHAVVGDFERDLAQLPRGGRRLFAFLGGTIGNLKPAERARFLSQVAAQMGPEDSFLLGTDLVKSIDRLERAYDDARGVTAEFNRNVLRVLNRELQADFDPEAFVHLARFDEAQSWIEMWLVPRSPQRVRLEALDLALTFQPSEPLRTEVSTKFRREQVEAELAHCGLIVDEQWTDRAGDFALSLASRSGRSRPLR